jgi:hypothetical protein
VSLRTLHGSADPAPPVPPTKGFAAGSPQRQRRGLSFCALVDARPGRIPALAGTQRASFFALSTAATVARA